MLPKASKSGLEELGKRARRTKHLYRQRSSNGFACDPHALIGETRRFCPQPSNVAYQSSLHTSYSFGYLTCTALAPG